MSRGEDEPGRERTLSLDSALLPEGTVYGIEEPEAVGPSPLQMKPAAGKKGRPRITTDAYTLPPRRSYAALSSPADVAWQTDELREKVEAWLSAYPDGGSDRLAFAVKMPSEHEGERQAIFVRQVRQLGGVDVVVARCALKGTVYGGRQVGVVRREGPRPVEVVSPRRAEAEAKAAAVAAAAARRKQEEARSIAELRAKLALRLRPPIPLPAARPAVVPRETSGLSGPVPSRPEVRKPASLPPGTVPGRSGPAATTGSLPKPAPTCLGCLQAAPMVGGDRCLPCLADLRSRKGSLEPAGRPSPGLPGRVSEPGRLEGWQPILSPRLEAVRKRLSRSRPGKLGEELDRKTRQVRLRRSAGRCVDCGKVPAEEGSVRCARCRKKRRDYYHRRYGTEGWTPGGPGRPPLGVDYPRRTPYERRKKGASHP